MAGPVGLVQARRRARRRAGPDLRPTTSPAPGVVSGEVVAEIEEREGANRPLSRAVAEAVRLPPDWFRPGGVLAASPGLSLGLSPPPAPGVRPVEVRPAMVAGRAAGTVMCRADDMSENIEIRERLREIDESGREEAAGRGDGRLRSSRGWLDGLQLTGDATGTVTCRADQNERGREMRERVRGWAADRGGGRLWPGHQWPGRREFGRRRPWPPAALRPLFRTKQGIGYRLAEWAGWAGRVLGLLGRFRSPFWAGFWAL